MFLWYLVNSSNYLQHSLNMLMLLVSVIMTFFIMTVIHSIFYVYMYIVTVHYMGVKKNKAETLTLCFSCLALLLMGYTSLSLLYLHCTSVFFPDMCINVLGNQWYWLFDYSSYFDDSITMYMSNLDSLVVGDYRFLEANNRVVFPAGGGVSIGFNLPFSVGYCHSDGISSAAEMPDFHSSSVESFLTRLGNTYDAHHAHPLFVSYMEYILVGVSALCVGVVVQEYVDGLFTGLACSLVLGLFITDCVIFVGDCATAVFYTVWPF